MTADESDNVQPHGRFAWLQQGPEGYPPVPALPESFVGTNTSSDDLWEVYRRSVHDTPGMDEQFKVEMRLEDEYHAIIRSIIDEAGADAELSFYEGPWACTGGAKAGWDLLHIAAAQVRQAAISTGLPGLPLMVGIWPEKQMNARSVEVDGGVIAYVNSGLLVMLRMACHSVVSSLEAIDGAKHWGPDQESQEELSAAFLSRMDAYRAGVDPRVDSSVSVICGEREMFRRQLNYLGIAYVVAHEYGHALARRYVDYFWPDMQLDAPQLPPGPQCQGGNAAAQRGGGGRQRVVRVARGRDSVSHHVDAAAHWRATQRRFVDRAVARNGPAVRAVVEGPRGGQGRVRVDAPAPRSADAGGARHAGPR